MEAADAGRAAALSGALAAHERDTAALQTAAGSVREASLQLNGVLLPFEDQGIQHLWFGG